MQIVGKLSANLRCLIISGEESGLQVADRAKRLGLNPDNIEFLSTNNLDEALNVVSAGSERDYDFIVVDSVQTLAGGALESSAGTVSQIREVAQKFLEVAKSKKRIVVLVGHVTKDGNLAGPKLLEHMVDAVFYFESLNEGRSADFASAKKSFWICL